MDSDEVEVNFEDKELDKILKVHEMAENANQDKQIEKHFIGKLQS